MTLYILSYKGGEVPAAVSCLSPHLDAELPPAEARVACSPRRVQAKSGVVANCALASAASSVRSAKLSAARCAIDLPAAHFARRVPAAGAGVAR